MPEPERTPAELVALARAARAVGRVREVVDRSPVARLRGRGFPWRAPSVPAGVEPLPEEPRTGSRYDTEWARRMPARLARAAIVEGPLRLLVRGVAAPERTGLDRLDALEGPAVFAANHHSHVDAPLMITSIPEPWRHRLVVGAAADYFFATRVTSALSALALGAFPIDRARVNRRSADLAAELIDDGWSLLIFPEGGRSPDGWGQPFRGGAAYLSIRCAVPVVPVHVEGTGRILPKGQRLPAVGRTLVTFGPPLRPAEGEDARRFAVRIERAVAELADEAATDWWSARRRAAIGDTPSLGGPELPSWRRAWALGDTGRGRDAARRRREGRAWPKLD
ncbi:MAG: 1-acyl-sn-glycerol-3-phosphate acyltransferase [Acidimicrobiales bacterium]|nr:1-acyl-sn-glycerol-3-phosphate acyltransferase [Acidimicrobiales bacterium]